MRTIFNTYIEVESQEQADRLKQVCIDNGLPIWNNWFGFLLTSKHKNFFVFGLFIDEFLISESCRDSDGHTKITELEWMELLTKYKEEQCKKTID